MADCTNRQMVFPYYRHKPLTVSFKGCDIASDGGMLLVRQMDEQLKIVDTVVSALTDRRDPRYIDHDMMTLLRQQIYQMVAGYEDCNNAATLRVDPVFKLCCDRKNDPSDTLTSQPTLSCLENSIRPCDVYDLAETLDALYVSRFTKALKRIILDIDSTDDPTYGAQQLSLFNGFHRQHMYHPLLIFDGRRSDLLAAVLRAGNAALRPQAERCVI